MFPNNTPAVGLTMSPSYLPANHTHLTKLRWFETKNACLWYTLSRSFALILGFSRDVKAESLIGIMIVDTMKPGGMYSNCPNRPHWKLSAKSRTIGVIMLSW